MGFRWPIAPIKLHAKLCVLLEYFSGERINIISQKFSQPENI